MKKTLFTIFPLLLSFEVEAQDPGFRPPEAPPRVPAQSTVSGAGIITGAASLTSMDVLDTTRPIQPGYTISIRILEDRKPAEQQKVAVTGEVQVPYVGLIRAAGRTCRDLAMAIKRDLEKSFFISATVVIAIDDIPVNPRGPGGYEGEVETYTMFGFVMKQGKYDLPYNEDLSISQAILRAGGFAQFGDVKHVKIVRNTPQGEKRILVNVDDIMRKGDLQKDIYIRKNDVVIIPEKKINF